MYPDFEFIDTHAHLYLSQFDADRDVMLQEAREQGVTHICLPNIDASTIDAMLEMENRYQDRCHPMIGLHPCSVTADYRAELELIENWLERHRFCAIGEIGTDLYWDKTFYEQQVSCLTHQIELAKTYALPIVLHSRESLDLNIKHVAERQNGSLKGIFHCFTGTREQALRIIDLGFLLGIGGVLTFKNSGLAEVLKDLPLESMVLETDAPYLTPHPHRGERNESKFIPLIAARLAAALNISVEKVSEVTTFNAKALFGIHA